MRKENMSAIQAQAHLHHAYLLGLQLMVSTNQSQEDVADWMFRLFRRQHLDKFLASFEKLGLSGLPDAVACAKYHVLSNNVGGVGVEYMYESDQKAWVRFRYPRWMYHGPTICGVPIGVSRGFLNGWYAHNGVSLNNPRLAYVCVSEDMTGEFGLCGYFKEFDYDLSDDERLQFAKDELPPPFDPEAQPSVPADQWDELRLAKANRNYALDYIRNGIAELAHVIGEARTRELASRAARLIGLQYFAETAEMIGAQDGGVDDAAGYLATMMRVWVTMWNGPAAMTVWCWNNLVCGSSGVWARLRPGLFLIVGRSFGRAPPARSGSSNDLKCSVWVTLRAGLCRGVCDGTD